MILPAQNVDSAVGVHGGRLALGSQALVATALTLTGASDHSTRSVVCDSLGHGSLPGGSWWRSSSPSLDGPGHFAVTGARPGSGYSVPGTRTRSGESMARVGPEYR